MRAACIHTYVRHTEDWEIIHVTVSYLTIYANFRPAVSHLPDHAHRVTADGRS